MVAAAVVTLAVWPSSGSASVRTEEMRLAGAGEPAVSIDATVYLPETTPAPAVLVAHGFGGSKASVDADARELAGRGYVVLAWSARGFGASTGLISLNAPDAEVADAQRLVDYLATRPEVQLDTPGDPRVGVTGGSYGGALSLMLAGVDKRVDATAPVITWNDLGQALFPNSASAGPVAATTPAANAFSPDGVFKRGWAGIFFSAGLSPAGARSGPAAVTPGGGGLDPAAAAAAAAGAAGTGAATGTPAAGAATCGRFVPAICQAYTEAATTGRASPATTELLRRSSPASLADKITAPTLLVQGEQDTLFGLDQSDATARQIAAGGAPVRVVWFAGGHDGASPGPAVRSDINAWFDFHLAGRGADPGTGFSYAVQGGVRANASTPTVRTVTADAYPGLAASPATRDSIALQGGPQPVLNPPGGNPAAITVVPGVGGALGALAGRLSAVTAELPGQSATFTSEPVGSQVLIAGSAQVGVTVARVPGQPAADEAVLFGKVYELDPEGRRTLLGSAVAPLRVAVPASGAARATVTLPGVVAPIEAGNRVVVSISTTDQAYAGSTQPAVWQIGLAPTSAGAGGAVAVPVVPGRTVASNTVPIGQAIGIGLILLAALIAVVVGRIVTRRSRLARVEGARHDLPLEIEKLAKTYPGGVTAVDGVSFRVARGQVLGLLGPNGAGKTTVLRMLMGLIHPSSGTIRVFGHTAGPGAPVLSRVGSFVEGPGFQPHLSGAENLRLFWAATGRPAADAHLDEALEIAGLGDAIKRRVRTYSHGMRQRLAIAQAMLGLPDLLVLDEPTNGLDPPQIHAMREVLQDYAATGRTVLLSSHLLAEVEQTCSHVVVMHHGKVVADGPVAEIVAGGGHASFTVDDPSRAANVLRSANGVRGVEIVEGLVHADLNGMPRASAVDALVRSGVAVEAAGPRRRLEDAFLQLVGEDARP